MSAPRPCQTSPDGNTIWPGRPGESLEDYMARVTADYQEYLARHGPSNVALNRPQDRLGFWEHSR